MAKSENILTIKLKEEGQSSTESDAQRRAAPALPKSPASAGVGTASVEGHEAQGTKTSTEGQEESLPDPDLLLPDEEEVRSWWKKIFDSLTGIFVSTGKEEAEDALGGGGGGDGKGRWWEEEEDDEDDEDDEAVFRDEGEDEGWESTINKIPTPPPEGGTGTKISSMGSVIASGIRTAGSLLSGGEAAGEGEGILSAGGMGGVGGAGGGGGLMGGMNMGSAAGEGLKKFADALEQSMEVVGKWADFLDEQVDDLKAFDPQLLMETVTTDLAMLESRMQRAQSTGSTLSGWEGAKRDFMLAFEDLKGMLTLLVGVPLAVIVKILTVVMGILNLLLKTIGFFFGIVLQALHAILWALDVLTADQGVSNEFLDMIKGTADELLTLWKNEDPPNLDSIFDAWLNNPNMGVGAVAVGAGAAPGGRNVF